MDSNTFVRCAIGLVLASASRDTGQCTFVDCETLIKRSVLRTVRVKRAFLRSSSIDQLAGIDAGPVPPSSTQNGVLLDEWLQSVKGAHIATGLMPDDTAGDKNSTYFTVTLGSATYAVWLNNGGGSEPSHGADESIEVSYADDDTAEVISARVLEAIKSQGDFIGWQSAGRIYLASAGIVTIDTTVDAQIADGDLGVTSISRDVVYNVCPLPTRMFGDVVFSLSTQNPYISGDGSLHFGFNPVGSATAVTLDFDGSTTGTAYSVIESSHGRAVGDAVTLNGTLANGLEAGSVYYVATVVSANAYTVSPLPGSTSVASFFGNGSSVTVQSVDGMSTGWEITAASDPYLVVAGGRLLLYHSIAAALPTTANAEFQFQGGWFKRA